MIVLGIETSCDETSASIVQDGVWVLSNQTQTSLREHARFGGVIPEIASRRQTELIYPIVDSALAEAKVKLTDVDAIAYTQSPGLLGSLLVGISFAKGLGLALNKTLIPVDHIQGHLYASFLRQNNDSNPLPKLPAIGLVVSGGHTSLYKVSSFKRIDLLSQTQDDAAGEAFDKVARLLDLGYPGGPIIDRLTSSMEKSDIQFPKARLKHELDFSFSGVKTAVLYYVQKYGQDKNFSKSKVAFAFSSCVVDTLIEKALLACQKHRIRTLLVGGGVAANSMLRIRLFSKAKHAGVDVHIPPMAYCLDNAAMIAGLGFAQHIGN